jgi:hypothetical protein
MDRECNIHAAKLPWTVQSPGSRMTAQIVVTDAIGRHLVVARGHTKMILYQRSNTKARDYSLQSPPIWGVETYYHVTISTLSYECHASVILSQKTICWYLVRNIVFNRSTDHASSRWRGTRSVIPRSRTTSHVPAEFSQMNTRLLSSPRFSPCQLGTSLLSFVFLSLHRYGVTSCTSRLSMEG